MDKKILEKISKAHIFMNMPPEKILSFFKTSNYRISKYLKGSTIAMRGDLYNEFMVLLKGSVIGEMVDPDGNAIEVEVIRAPRPLAPAILFGKNNKLPVDIVACEECSVLFIPKNSVIRLLQSDVKILNHYLDIISNRAQFLSERLRLMSFKTIKEKFAYYISNMIKNENHEIIINKNHQELSDYFGVTRPALSRVISEMEKNKIISLKKKKLKIIDINRIENVYRVDVRILPETILVKDQSVEFKLISINLIEPTYSIKIQDKNKKNVFELNLKNELNDSFVWFAQKEGDFELIMEVTSENRDIIIVKKNFSILDMKKLQYKFYQKILSNCIFSK